MKHWLLKTEPETYSFQTLLKEKKTHWNGVRNFQARNNLREMKLGDLALIYHSGKDKAVTGIARIAREGYSEIDSEDGSEWVQVEIEAVQPLAQPVTLATLKATKSLQSLPLIKQSRLSVMPISPSHYQEILRLGK